MSSERSRSGGSVKRHHRQPIVEVGSEATGSHLGFEVAVGGRHNAHVDGDRPLSADALQAPLREHAQEPDLQVHRHLADLVEEDGAFVGELEMALARRHRAGEGATLVPEELAFEQALGHRAAVDGDERAARARALGVDRARQPLLADAGLAEDEQRAVGTHHAARDGDEPLHGRAHQHEVVEAIALVGTLGLEPAQPILAAALDQRPQSVEQDRIRHAVVEHGETAGGEHLGALVGEVIADDDDHLGSVGELTHRRHQTGG